MTPRHVTHCAEHWKRSTAEASVDMAMGNQGQHYSDNLDNLVHYYSFADVAQRPPHSHTRFFLACFSVGFASLKNVPCLDCLATRSKDATRGSWPYY